MPTRGRGGPGGRRSIPAVLRAATTGGVPFVAVAGLTLPVGFLVAELTGVRAVGGLVLVAGLAGCLVLARREGVRLSRAAAVVVVAVVAFVAAHPLGRAIPAPAAVLIAGALVAAAAGAARRRSPLSGTAA